MRFEFASYFESKNFGRLYMAAWIKMISDDEADE